MHDFLVKIGVESSKFSFLPCWCNQTMSFCYCIRAETARALIVHQLNFKRVCLSRLVTLFKKNSNLASLQSVRQSCLPNENCACPSFILKKRILQAKLYFLPLTLCSDDWRSKFSRFWNLVWISQNLGACNILTAKLAVRELWSMHILGIVSMALNNKLFCLLG